MLGLYSGRFKRGCSLQALEDLLTASPAADAAHNTSRNTYACQHTSPLAVSELRPAEDIAYSVTDPKHVVPNTLEFPPPKWWPEHERNTCNGYIPDKSVLARFVWVGTVHTSRSEGLGAEGVGDMGPCVSGMGQSSGGGVKVRGKWWCEGVCVKSPCCSYAACWQPKLGWTYHEGTPHGVARAPTSSVLRQQHLSHAMTPARHKAGLTCRPVMEWNGMTCAWMEWNDL
eukprot:365151-Chlamydomonas_euryale.AAC.2